VGYTLELWAVPVEAVTKELRAPSLGPNHLDDATVPADVVDRWDDLAATVAEAVAAGGGELAGDEAVYAQLVVRQLGTRYGSLNHTSAGGPEFRNRFLAGPVAERFGRTFVSNLVNRPLAGLTWADYPTLGWVTTDELNAALATAETPSGGVERPEDVEPLHTLDRAIQRAATMGLDIITVYG
jgi:hypothetical protein